MDRAEEVAKRGYNPSVSAVLVLLVSTKAVCVLRVKRCADGGA
jgi:hypothetical protein